MSHLALFLRYTVTCMGVATGVCQYNIPSVQKNPSSNFFVVVLKVFSFFEVYFKAGIIGCY